MRGETAVELILKSFKIQAFAYPWNHRHYPDAVEQRGEELGLQKILLVTFQLKSKLKIFRGFFQILRNLFEDFWEDL